MLEMEPKLAHIVNAAFEFRNASGLVAPNQLGLDVPGSLRVSSWVTWAGLDLVGHVRLSLKDWVDALMECDEQTRTSLAQQAPAAPDGFMALALLIARDREKGCAELEARLVQMGTEETLRSRETWGHLAAHVQPTCTYGESRTAGEVLLLLANGLNASRHS
jgi:hypothetical protein